MSDINNIGRTPAGIKALESQSTQRKEEEKGTSKEVLSGVRLVNEREGYSVDISAGSQGLGRSERSESITNSDDARELAANLKSQIFAQSDTASMAQANIGPHSVLSFLK
ncbi:MAG: hypothetical protein JJU41_13710 [Bacteroidetes bacterium]|nr:hypothetical protein [Bacteroidota bacterium]